MGISVMWDNEQKTTVRQVFDNNWDWADYNESIAQIRQLMRSVGNSVDLISDIRSSKPQVRGLAHEHFQQALLDVPSNAGMIVIAGKGNFTASIFAIVAQTSGKLAARTRFVSTLAEAYITLEKARFRQIQ